MKDSNLQESAVRKPPNAGKGRPKGSVNKLSGDLRQMISKALDQVGGVDYLAKQAEENPSAFISLLGKTMPKEITGADGKDLFPFEAIKVHLVRPGG